MDKKLQTGNTKLGLAVARDSLEEFRCLVSDKDEVLSQDSYGRTPIHIAAKMGKLEYVKLLLENGAAPNMPDMTKPTLANLIAGREAVCKKAVSEVLQEIMSWLVVSFPSRTPQELFESSQTNVWAGKTI